MTSGMGELVKVFKPDQSTTMIFRFMLFFGLCIAVLGFLTHIAMITCAGITGFTIFAALAFRQPNESIEINEERIIFKYANQVVWTLPLDAIGGIQIATTLKHATRYSPGRTLLLRLMDLDNKLCAEVNVSVYDKTVIRQMLEVITRYKKGLVLNGQAQQLLQIPQREALQYSPAVADSNSAKNGVSSDG